MSPGTVIFQSMNFGFPGTGAENDPSWHTAPGFVAQYAIGSSGNAAANINFGDPLILLPGSKGNPVYQQAADWLLNNGGAQGTLPGQFAGIARRAVKSNETYMPAPTLGYYAAGAPIEAIYQGMVSVNVGGGITTIGAKVYIRTTANSAVTPDAIGIIEGWMSDYASNQALLNNVVFRSGIVDGNGNTMIHIQTPQAT